MQKIKNLWVMLLLIIVTGFLSVWFSFSPVSVVSKDVADRFSAERAHADVRNLIPENLPHPSGSFENRATRDRIIAAFKALNIETSLEESMVCRGFGRFSVHACANITNIIAPIKAGTGKPIILMAHYDSVAAGPGAGDDIHGVAIILEIARLISGDDGFTNPVIGLITDGEENGLFGARAYFQDNNHVKAAGLVINVEARGNQGPSLLFETSEDAAWLVDIFADNASKPMTNSLMRAAYKILPNDTDLSESLDAGVAGLNFAFAGNVAHYHTSLDTPENLNLTSLQHQGDNVLAMVQALKSIDFDHAPKGDALYIDILSKFVLSVSVSFLWPLIGGAFILLGAHAWLAKDKSKFSIKAAVGAILFVPLLVVGAAVIGLAISYLTGLFGEQAPGFAVPMPFRLALYFGSWALLVGLSVLMARWVSPKTIHYSVWGWAIILSGLMAIYAEGGAVVFIFPAFIAAILTIKLEFEDNKIWSSLLSAVSMLIVWGPLVYLFEVMFGFNLPPVISVVAVLAIVGFAPLITYSAINAEKRWVVPIASLVTVIGFTVMAGLTPSFNEQRPLGLNVIHLTDNRDGTVQWRLSTRSASLLPEEMHTIANFGDQADNGIPFLVPGGFSAPAPKLVDTLPIMNILSDREEDGLRKVKIDFSAPQEGGRLAILIPKEAMPKDAVFEETGASLSFIEEGTFQNYHILTCSAGNCGDVEIRLASKTPHHWVKLVTTYRLPDIGQALAHARPAWTVPYQDGDTIITIHEQEI